MAMDGLKLALFQRVPYFFAQHFLLLRLLIHDHGSLDAAEICHQFIICLSANSQRELFLRFIGFIIQDLEQNFSEFSVELLQYELLGFLIQLFLWLPSGLRSKNVRRIEPCILRRCPIWKWGLVQQVLLLVGLGSPIDSNTQVPGGYISILLRIYSWRIPRLLSLAGVISQIDTLW